MSDNTYNIETIEITDLQYPQLLRMLDKAAPARLYCIGDVSLMSERCAAVVGSRNASHYGLDVAFNAGRALAEAGIVTVSGMAYGCDAKAHEGALYEGGKTIAVLAGGVDICYPRRNAGLYRRIAESGLIISENPPGTDHLPAYFPQRNRIISGLSEVTLVAEAALKSGSLITADCAADQGRTVFAAPGEITNIRSIGCNKLIQDGALPLVSVEDIVRAMGAVPVPKKARLVRELGLDERRVYDIVKSSSEVTSDYIARSLDRKVSDINALVTVLEIKGLVQTDMGKIYIAI